MINPGSTEPHLGVDEYSRLLFEEASDGVFISSADGVYLEVNRSGHRLLGYDHGELIGKPIAQVVGAGDIPRLRAALTAVAQGEVQMQVWSMVRKDGSTVQLEVLAQLLSTGKVMAVVRDLNARAAFDRKVHASEAALRSILSTAPDAILTVDRAGRILFINRTYPPFTVEQVIGTSCFDYVLPEARARVEQAIEHVFTTRSIDSYEVESPPDPEGRRGWSSVRVGPLIENDQVVAATMCATDVTEQKRAGARTRELLERLAKIASLVPGVVYQYQLRPDGTACFPYASDRIREVFHVAPEDVRDDATRAFEVIHPDDYPGVMASIQHSAATLEPWHHEFRVMFASGEVHWLFANSVPQRQPDGSTLWHGFITDVTDHRQAAQARAKLEEQLRQAQKMETVGQLAGGVAHDFNNMLTTIVAFVELTQDDLPHDAPLREYLDGILAATTRGASLTQQLLAFARKKIVQPEDANINAILNRMAPMIRRLVGEHIDVELALSPQSRNVKVDVGSLEQVIVNLIVNARDAMPNGGHLTLETQDVLLDERHKRTLPDIAPGNYAVLAVTDTGTGMTPDIRSHLFEPFFTTKPPGMGTGLGLAMCHGIVKQAGGAITADSEPDRGSSFRIYLPCRETNQRAPSVPVRAARAAAGHETLLVVEDEPMILRVAQTALERLGYRVLCASDGLEALELVRRTPSAIDLLVTDVVMPKLGGHELAKRLQELRPNTKVLYTSGYTENTIATQGVLREGVNFIQKPYALATLAKRVRELLDRR